MKLKISVTTDQVAENFEKVFKGILDTTTYEKDLKEVLDSFKSSPEFNSSASFVLNEEGDAFNVEVDTKNHKFKGISKKFHVQNPHGGSIQGNLIAFTSNLFDDTTKFVWYNGSILGVYFHDNNGQLLGYFLGDDIEALKPADGSGKGDWSN